MARTAGRFNTLTIVPLITFQEVIEKCKKIENGTFFETRFFLGPDNFIDTRCN